MRSLWALYVLALTMVVVCGEVDLVVYPKGGGLRACAAGAGAWPWGRPFWCGGTLALGPVYAKIRLSPFLGAAVCYGRLFCVGAFGARSVACQRKGWGKPSPSSDAFSVALKAE